MPFIEQVPKPFTENGINLNPNQKGVYGILKNPQNPIWIYVGQAEDIRDRLLQHLHGNDGNPCILREGPTHWVGEVNVSDIDEREKELILELDPICNKRVG